MLLNMLQTAPVPTRSPDSPDAHDAPWPAHLPRLPRRRTSDRLVRLARSLAAREDLWAAHVQFAHDERHAVRVAVAPDFEAWLLTWLPGQSTGLHDHGGSPGALVVLRGTLDEAVLAPPRGPAPAALVHRALERGRARVFGPHHVHKVLNTGAEPAVSLHVYAPALETMRRLVLDGEGRARIVALERSGVDW
jgi:predicted metal-dependent enzyme (double-stranded beta helix superfamily)